MGGGASVADMSKEDIIQQYKDLSLEDKMKLCQALGFLPPPFAGDGEDEPDDGDVDDNEPSDVAFMSARVEVGSKDDEDESKRVEVTFPRAFAGDGEPVVVLCGEGEAGTTYGDCFSACVVETTNEGFKANFGRQHPSVRSWGQNAQMNWFAVKAKSSGLLRCGVAEVGSKDDEEQTKLIEIEFDPPFKMVPTVMATALGEDYPDAFTVTTRKITQKRAEILVGRTNPNYKSWGQNLRMNWVATTIFPRAQVTVGPFDEGEGGQKQIEVAIPPLAKRPTIFVVPQHQPGSGYFDGNCCTVTNLQREGGCFKSFTLNTARVHPEATGWGQNLRANVIYVP